MTQYRRVGGGQGARGRCRGPRWWVALLSGALVAALGGGEAAAAQRAPFVRMGFGAGSAIEQLGLGPTLGADAVHTAGLEVGWRLWGSTGWRADFNGPSLGAGLLTSEVTGTVDFGRPVAVYGFFHWPLVEGARTQLRLELVGGLAAGWRPFDHLSNPDQRAIGSPVTALVQMTPTVVWHVTDQWGLTLGVAASHFSNGALAQPNGGLTTVTPMAGLVFAPAGGVRRRRPVSMTTSTTVGAAKPAGAPSEASPWGWRARVYGGIQTVRVEAPTRAFTHRSAIQGLGLSARRQLTPTLSALATLDLLHDPTGLRLPTIAASTPLEGLSVEERLSLGSSLGLEWAIGRVRLETAWGGTMLRRDLGDQVRRRYEKFGVAVAVRTHVEVGVMVRSSRGISDFIEVGVAVGSGRHLP